MDRTSAASNLMDTHNRLVADILTRYRSLMMLATNQAEGGRNNANPETVSVTGISMQMEFDGLNSSMKELLTLSRRIKELWVFGPLGQEDTDRKVQEDQIERDVAQVSGLLNTVDAMRMKALAEANGGQWSALTKEESAALMAQTGRKA
ncbi:hypothetical protein VHEMI02194 [[Torrubiella] hemipterigena]|uniref:Uncharacterized protein n=1 Tax=[Torrubiella] hemipterigena TaxID=1531966 RepID=A0A0A1SV49_9HYPO|nr:hypothetical protein VHEMI02194 [[Torrubiella] hemipterigena]